MKRVTLTMLTRLSSEAHAAIIGWAGRNDINERDEAAYATERRMEVQLPFKDLRSMEELLQYII